MTAELSHRQDPTPRPAPVRGEEGLGGLIEPVKAPWIRPGVVVHDPEAIVDPLLARFAAEIAERGFAVHGHVRDTAIGDRALQVDLATGTRFAEETGHSVRVLRRAMREDADLVVIGRFSACTEATDDVRPSFADGPSQGLPLLTAIAGQCIHQWHSYVRRDGAMIAPDLPSLWHWWGPERLYRDLALGVSEDEVLRIVCGPRWLMVEGPNGTGLAHLPRHPRDLLPRLPRLARESLRRLATFAGSWDPLEAALGVAAVNAHYNARDLEGAPGNGIRRFRRIDGRVVVIGAFPGVDAILPQRAVVEIDPRPGDYPMAAVDTLLPSSAGAVINSSALVNRSLPRLLRLARNRPVGLVGPSTPLTPRLHTYGIATMGGLVAEDVDGLALAIRAGATPREFSQYCRQIHIHT